VGEVTEFFENPRWPLRGKNNLVSSEGEKMAICTWKCKCKRVIQGRVYNEYKGKRKGIRLGADEGGVKKLL